MNIETIIYLADRLPEIACLLTIASVIFLCIISFIIFYERDVNFYCESEKEIAKHKRKKLIPMYKWAILAIFIGVICPSEKLSI